MRAIAWTRIQTPAFLLACCATVLACDGSRASPPAPTERDTVTAARRLGTLEARVSAPARVRKGSPVAVSVDLINRGDTAITLNTPGDAPFDIIVVALSGDSVWRYPAAGDRPAIARINPPIPPGDSQALGTLRWDQTDSRGRRVPPGTYQVNVTLVADPPWGAVTVGPVRVMVDP